MSDRIELDAPSIGALEKRYVLRALKGGFVSTYGPYVREFELKLADFLGGGSVAVVQSGTAALHMALLQLGLGPGDEVLVPSMTFIASVNPVMYVGAKPVFVDVDPLTWNISPAAIEKKITARTKAILCVHLYGNCCDMRQIISLARRHKLAVVEDATESLGSSFDGRHTGMFGQFGCFSFNGNKLITTGGGGAIWCRHAAAADRFTFLANQARPGVEYIHTDIGFNYRMTNLEASLGLAQLERLGGFIEIKRKFRETYLRATKGLSLVWQQEYPGAASCFWLNALLFKTAAQRRRAQHVLCEEGIPSRRLFAPIRESRPYATAAYQDFTQAYALYERGLCLPSSVVNTHKDILKVCSVLQKVA